MVLLPPLQKEPDRLAHNGCVLLFSPYGSPLLVAAGEQEDLRPTLLLSCQRLEFEIFNRKRRLRAQGRLPSDLLLKVGEHVLELTGSRHPTAEPCEIETLEMGGVCANAARYPDEQTAVWRKPHTCL
jgi:hypothetical protein